MKLLFYYSILFVPRVLFIFERKVLLFDNKEFARCEKNIIKIEREQKAEKYKITFLKGEKGK